MALKHKYLHAYANLPAVPRGRLITGILIGLLFAFCFYAFLYVCREALRILFFMTNDYDVLVLSDFISSTLDFFRIMATIYLIIVIIYIYNSNYMILIYRKK